MPAAARIADPTAHPGIIAGPGEPTVLIEGLPAARVGDTHVCAIPVPPGPHPPTPIVIGSPTVLIGGMPAARMGDVSACGSPIILGALTVMIDG